MEQEHKMSEQHIPIHEKHETKRFSAAELKEHHERLQESLEKNAEKASTTSSHEQEQLQQEALEQAITADEVVAKPQETKPLAHFKSEDKIHAFETTMHHVRKNLTASERTFSKLIHQPAIEKTSDALGKTIARPSGMIGATIAAAIGLLSIYSIAKFAGFELSGSEMPLLLVAGFGVGLFAEWAYKTIRVLIAPRQS